MPLEAEDIVAELRADPLKFFRRYKLTIAGGARGGASGVATFRFEDKGWTVRGFTTGFSGIRGKVKDRPELKFSKQAALDPNPDIDDGYFNAHYVAMIQDTANAVAGSHYALPTAGPTSDANPDLMLTSQLSNCTFGIGSANAGVQLVSHMEPNLGGGLTRPHLHASVTGGMDHGTDAVFERENQGGATGQGYGNMANRATVVAVRVGVKWKYYAQSYISGGKGAILTAKKLA